MGSKAMDYGEVTREENQGPTLVSKVPPTHTLPCDMNEKHCCIKITRTLEFL